MTGVALELNSVTLMGSRVTVESVVAVATAVVVVGMSTMVGVVAGLVDGASAPRLAGCWSDDEQLVAARTSPTTTGTARRQRILVG